MLELILASIIKGSVLLLLALFIAHSFRSKTAAEKHNYLAAALLVLLLVPVLELAPKLELQLLPAHGHEAGQPTAGKVLAVMEAALPQLLFVYCLGLCLGLLRLAIQHLRLLALLKQAKPCTGSEYQLLEAASEQVGVLELKGLSTPLAAGVFRPRIVVPEGFFAQDKELVDSAMRHELAHIRRKDWLMQLLSQILQAVFWFNPLVHYCARCMKVQAEIAADDEVVLAGAAAPEYAGRLLGYAKQCRARRKPDSSWVAMLGPELADRIRSLTARTPRRYYDGFGLSESLVVFVLVLLPFTVIKAVPVQELYFKAPQDTVLERAVVPEKPVIVCECVTEEIKPSLPTGPMPEHGHWSAVQWHAPRPEPLQVAYTVPMPQYKAQILAAASPEPRISSLGFLPLRSVMPRYPLGALKRGQQGYVDLKFDIDTEGRVINAVVVRSEPGRVFDRAALKALRKSGYAPHRVNGEAVIVRGVSNRYVFRLTEPHEAPQREFTGPTLIAQGESHVYL